MANTSTTTTTTMISSFKLPFSLSLSLLLLSLSLLPCARAIDSFRDRIPNGRAKDDPESGLTCDALGHQTCIPGAQRNPFGLDFAAEGYAWTVALCEKDSDGDGLTNGQELGDPCCVWTKGDTPARVTELSHPGDATSTNDASSVSCPGSSSALTPAPPSASASASASAAAAPPSASASPSAPMSMSSEPTVTPTPRPSRRPRRSRRPSPSPSPSSSMPIMDFDPDEKDDEDPSVMGTPGTDGGIPSPGIDIDIESPEVEPSPSPSASSSSSASMSVSASPSVTASASASMSPIEADGSMSPEMSPSPDADDPPCFPAGATVTLADGRARRMDAVAVGDDVLVGAGVYSRVFMLSHATAVSKGEFEFVRVETESGRVLTLTPGHYLYVSDAREGHAPQKLRRADTVTAGKHYVSVIGSEEEERMEQVVRTSRVRDTGLYNPQTLHGDIVVNGVKASTYTTAIHAPTAHGLLAPLRAVFRAVRWSTAAFESGGRAWLSVLPRGAGEL